MARVVRLGEDFQQNGRFRVVRSSALMAEIGAKAAKPPIAGDARRPAP